jgi:glyoxylase-like metal-dependent hydrolase (beta-lactamase superfamily II)
MAARGGNYLNSLRRDLGAVAEGSEIVPPSRTIAAAQVIELDLGGRTVDIRAWPPAHTDNDLTVYDRTTKTLWLGDLLFVQHTPVADSRISGFLEAMQVLRSIDARSFIPGHGRTDARWPAALDPQERYFKLVMRETRDALKRRRTLMEAVDEVGLSESGDWVNFDTYHRRNVTAAYTELEWEE